MIVMKIDVDLTPVGLYEETLKGELIQLRFLASVAIHVDSEKMITGWCHTR